MNINRKDLKFLQYNKKDKIKIVWDSPLLITYNDLISRIWFNITGKGQNSLKKYYDYFIDENPRNPRNKFELVVRVNVKGHFIHTTDLRSGIPILPISINFYYRFKEINVISNKIVSRRQNNIMQFMALAQKKLNESYKHFRPFDSFVFTDIITDIKLDQNKVDLKIKKERDIKKQIKYLKRVANKET